MPVDTESPIRALNGILRRADAPRRLRANVDEYLGQFGVEGEDLEVMRTAGAERMLVYRALVHNRMRNTIQEFIPRTVARLGFKRYRSEFTTFMEQRAAKSYYLRDVPAEFASWAAERWPERDSILPYLIDLARHEVLDQDVRNELGGGEPSTGKDMELEKPLRFDGSARIVRYGYAVHLLPRDIEDRSEPQPQDTALLVYRDRQTFRIRYLELSDFAAILLERLIGAHMAVRPALEDACRALGEDLGDDRLGQAAILLAELAQREVMLGAE